MRTNRTVLIGAHPERFTVVASLKTSAVLPRVASSEPSCCSSHENVTLPPHFATKHEGIYMKHEGIHNPIEP